MESDSGALIRFAVNGQRFELSRSDVVNCLADVAPDTIRKHAVKVNGTWFPVIQAFEAATGIPRSEFISHTARRHLAALGFEVAGSVESRTAPEAFRATYASPSLRMSRGNEKHRNLAGEWHTEASVQASMVTALVAEGGPDPFPSPDIGRKAVSAASQDVDPGDDADGPNQAEG